MEERASMPIAMSGPDVDSQDEAPASRRASEPVDGARSVGSGGGFPIASTHGRK
jgi:hypothetical protein